MRKLQLCLLSALVLLFVSCGSKLSLIKRHYTKGFYFANSKSIKHINPDEELVEENKADQRNPSSHIVPDNGENQYSIERSSINDTVAFSKETIKKEVLILKSSEQELKREYAKNNAGLKIKQKAAYESGGLSLFWIVVLILLILWALGLLAGGLGLGVFINILLVVAVLLLILWLLRVV